jgi:hypothetical protein
MDPLCKAPSLPTNIRLGWKYVVVASILAYCDMAIITAPKSFIVQAGASTKNIFRLYVIIVVSS